MTLADALAPIAPILVVGLVAFGGLLVLSAWPVDQRHAGHPTTRRPSPRRTPPPPADETPPIHRHEDLAR